MTADRTNVADRLAAIASRMPDAMAVVSIRGGSYDACTFRELDADANALGRGLIDLGLRPGHRIVLLVKPGVHFVKLVFALLRTGATAVLVDPGMGRRRLIECLAAAKPHGFIAVSPAHAARMLHPRRFPHASINVTVGRRWFWGGPTYKHLLKRGRASGAALPTTGADDPAAIIFTSGSTGPPKGVLYTHEMFDTQASEIQRAYGLQPGGVDLACFALFGLFNSAMGVTTVFPHMDFSRPAAAKPVRLLAAANAWKVTQAFASPAVWDKLSRHCESTGQAIPSLREVFSCGAPVPATVLQRTLQMVHPDAHMHTPYGATEALPIATIEAQEVIGETAAITRQGGGVCVGRKFDTVDWRVVRITDDAIAHLDEASELPPGEIGELIVRGPQVSREYMAPPRIGRSSDQSEAEQTVHPPSSTANSLAKIRDGYDIWHRMGDVGYFDDQQRFWYCGRKSQRVETSSGPLYTECVESILNQHPEVAKCALVGVGPPSEATPVVIIEAAAEPLAGGESGMLSVSGRIAWERLVSELRSVATRHPHTSKVDTFLLYPMLPVDVRHNSKINRERLALWAEQHVQLARGAVGPRSLTGG